MQPPACILIVDDESELRTMLRLLMEKSGYRTLQAENGARAVHLCRENPVDAIIMDVMMPVMDGMEACRIIRSFSDVPIILLTVQSEEDDLIKGFSAGAYDYLTKPFRTRELVARVQSLLKRVHLRPPVPGRKLVHGDLSLDPRTRMVLLGSEPVEISAMGYQILEYFMQHAGEVISKEVLLREIWAYEDPVGGKNMVEAAIKRLRRELRDDPRDPHYIRTIWGVGYRFG